MVETLAFLAGLGFSLLVWHRSIRPSRISPFRKSVYFLFSFIGITGTVFLFGVLAAYFLKKLGMPGLH